MKTQQQGDCEENTCLQSESSNVFTVWAGDKSISSFDLAWEREHAMTQIFHLLAHAVVNMQERAYLFGGVERVAHKF